LRNFAVAAAVMFVRRQRAARHLQKIALPSTCADLCSPRMRTVLVWRSRSPSGVKARRAGWTSDVTRIQPSEVMRLALPLMLAWYFHSARVRASRWTSWCGVLMALPVALIANSPTWARRCWSRRPACSSFSSPACPGNGWRRSAWPAWPRCR